MIFADTAHAPAPTSAPAAQGSSLWRGLAWGLVISLPLWVAIGGVVAWLVHHA